jgi:hypothetical protein
MEKIRITIAVLCVPALEAVWRLIASAGGGEMNWYAAVLVLQALSLIAPGLLTGWSPRRHPWRLGIVAAIVGQVVAGLAVVRQTPRELMNVLLSPYAPLIMGYGVIAALASALAAAFAAWLYARCHRSC